MIKNVFIKIGVEVSRLILGVAFLFSGFTKADDPWGTAYKIEDYLSAFNLSSFSSLALAGSVLQSIVEFMMGALMLFGLYRRWNSRLVLLTMLFMTPLTLYLAINNPVEDCGCFGDALILSNWDTFFKNLVLLACAIFVVIFCERISNFFTGKTYWLAFLYILLFVSFFIVRNYVYDPLFDFRPYKVGVNIWEDMQVEEGKGRQEESVLIYAKEGKEESFTDQNAPWEDSTWTFVRTETKLISEGESPPIKDFSITKLNFDPLKTELIGQEDITEKVLRDTNYVFLMVSPLLGTMDKSYLPNFEDVQNYAIQDNNYSFYCLTASGATEILQWSNENTIDFEFCNTDERTLKTIMRCNPSLLLLKNGEIINKWGDIDVPSEEDLSATLHQLPYGTKIDSGSTEKKHIVYFLLVFFVPLLSLKLLDFSLFRKYIEERKNTDKLKEE